MKIHFIGIGGIGVSALAKYYLFQGHEVSGSDLSSSEITDSLKQRGIKILFGHKAKNVPEDADMVIYSLAVSPNNPELRQAKKLQAVNHKPQVLSYFQSLGELSKRYFTIAVSGTNGKSTTASILGLILEKAKFDPFVIVGSKIKQKSWSENLRMEKNKSCAKINPAQNKYFVVEACEWRANMLNLKPQAIVLTNIEEDHLDYYQDINHIRKTFKRYIEKLPKDGFLVVNGDDKDIQLILKNFKSKTKIITFGQNQNSNFQIKDITKKPGLIKFTLKSDKDKFKQEFTLRIPGLFNVYNAVGAAVAALELGAPLDVIKKTLAEFQGIWRRFEKVGEKNGAIIISDYGHTPNAIQQTIQAAKDFYPDKRIMIVFQPHHKNRTKKLFEQFTACFDQADFVILAEIFEVIGREDERDKDISSKDLVEEIKKRPAFKDKQILYAKDLKQTKKLILDNLISDDVILLVGAGDIYTINLSSI